MPDIPTRAGTVALVGLPNVGKSSLLNRLLGSKLSIVTPFAQTTRERVVGIDSRDGVQMVFLDTPGIVAPAYLLHHSLIEIVDSLLLNETLAKVEYSFPDAIDAFVSTVESRDPYLKGHMRRVCELSVAIADELKVPDTLMRAASYAALLHDIGKLGLPATILFIMWHVTNHTVTHRNENLFQLNPLLLGLALLTPLAVTGAPRAGRWSRTLAMVLAGLSLLVYGLVWGAEK